MAVPKKRTGKSAQGKRRANWKATVPATTTCKSCGSVIPTHTVCPECGSYKGKAASIKAENKEEVKEVKTAKEEVKAEETKEEKPKAKRTRKPKAAPAETETKEEKTEE